MTWGELEKYASAALESGITDSIDDWRPASDMYIDDIVNVVDDKAIIPFGIRYWLKNGDSIIYVCKTKEPAQ